MFVKKWTFKMVLQSHNPGGVFFSGQDGTTISSLNYDGFPNNTGEVTAVLEALLFAADPGPLSAFLRARGIAVVYDSVYGAHMTLANWFPVENKQLIAHTRAARRRLETLCPHRIAWRHVKSHDALESPRR